jgi:adenine/guanine/hypoxanthine permease
MTETNTTRRVQWLSWGDLNAFFGLFLDNLLNLVVVTGLLVGVFQFPAEFALTHMIPGTALGVLVGDLIYTWMAIRLARRLGRDDVTAMPLGLDTPSTIGIALVVLGPSFLAAKGEGLSEDAAAMVSWQVGMATMIIMGLVKVAFAFVGDWVRRTVPSAGLLGSIAGIGLTLLGFFPLLHVFRAPIAGMIALGLVIYGLMAGRRLPLGIPAAFAAVLIGTVLYHGLGPLGLLGTTTEPIELSLSLALPVPTLGFVAGLGRAMSYLPVAIPFGILTIVGGINVTESARLAGDDYRTRDILLTEALATLVAGLFGGVVQSTPYIGHPAYKRMGGRAGYTLFTGLFIGLGAALGLVQFVVRLVPQAAVTPILLFVGLEILTQAQHHCPKPHAAAVGVALLPSVAELIRIILAGFGHVDPAALQGEPASQLAVIMLLGRGFIITAMLWGSAVALVIDGKRRAAGWYLLVCAVLTLLGLIHSIDPAGSLYVIWQHAPPPDGLIGLVFRLGESWVGWQLPGEAPRLVAMGYAILAACLLPLKDIKPSVGEL